MINDATTLPARFPRRAIALLVTVVISGCAVGPDFTRPDSTLPERYAASAVDQESAPFVETAWWVHFKDPLLNDLITRALDQNADVRAAVARVERAEAAAREAGASFLPGVDAEVSTGRARLSTGTATATPGTPTHITTHSASLNTSYELDVWGRVRRTNEAARASAFASHYARDAIRLSIAGLVASNYLALRAYDAQLAVSAESLASREETLQLVRTRVDAGIVSPLDLYQAEGALAAIQAQGANLRLRRAVAQHLLALLTGTPDLQIAPGDLRQVPMPPVPPAGLPSLLVQGRPDVRQAEENLVAANASIGAAKAGYFPRFSLTGSLGSESDDLSRLFTSGATTGFLGLGAFMPILDWSRTSARVDQASDLTKESVEAYQNSLQTAFKEVNDALVGLRETATEDEAQAARVEAATKALDMAKLRYESGHSEYLEVLDAERTANDSLLAFISTRQSRLTAAVELFKALGGGWKDDVAQARQAVAGPAKPAS